MLLSEFKEKMSQVDLTSQSSVSHESISNMVLNIEASIKAELAPIFNLLLPLPTKAHPGHVAQGEIRGLVLQKDQSKTKKLL